MNLSELDVLALSDTTDQLIVDGDSLVDTVHGVTSNGLGWTDAGLLDLDGESDQSFTAGGATLLVNTDIGNLDLDLLA